MTTFAHARLVVPVSESDHILGPPTAPVTLVEYGDFECPHCGAAHLVLTTLKRRMGDDFRLVFRHFPLAQMHPNAEPAAETAEAAGTKGQFWKMHDILFSNQQHLEPASLIRYGEQAGLDPDWLSEALASNSFAAKVRADFAGGVRSGVNGTPTFYFDGVRYDRPVNVDSMERAIYEAIESKQPNR